MKNWAWKLYGIFLSTVILNSLKDIFIKDSSFRVFYTILIAFDKRYILFLALNIIDLLINIFAAIVVFYYIFNVKRSLKLWKALFLLRIGFDLIGHFYDIQFIKAAFFQNLTYGLACIGVLALPMLPSYLAHYKYAFKKSPTLKNQTTQTKS